MNPVPGFCTSSDDIRFEVFVNEPQWPMHIDKIQWKLMPYGLAFGEHSVEFSFHYINPIPYRYYEVSFEFDKMFMRNAG